MKIKELELRSSAGRRSFNEDAVLGLEQVPLLAVADGMGGRGVGEVAAEMALSCLRTNASFLAAEIQKVERERTPQRRERLHQLLETNFDWAHREIQRAGREQGRRRMATTLLAAVIAGDHAHLAHVGNSRAYLLRGGRLRQLTQDHTVAAARETVREPGDAPSSGESRRLLQIVGAGAIDVDVAQVALADDDILLLCTDGLSLALDDVTLQAMIDPAALGGTADALLSVAERQGDDNVAFALARVGAARDSRSVDQIAEVLRAVFLFDGLEAAERYLVAPFLEERRYPEGTPFIVEGDEGEEFFIIAEGTVRVSRGGVHLIDIGAGGHLGELTLARPSPRSATVTALTDTTVFALSRARFQQIVARRPRLGARLTLQLLDTVSGRLRDLTDRLARTEQLVRHRPGDARALFAAIRGEPVPPPRVNLGPAPLDYGVLGEDDETVS